LADHQIRHHVATERADTTVEDLTRPDFWANVCDNGRMRPCDIIHVHPADGSYFAELIVRAVHNSRPVAGVKGGAIVHVLRHIQFDTIDRQARPPSHKIAFGGPAARWVVTRLSDDTIVAQNLASREDAEKHLAGLVKAGAA
jgi:hypothetical protein